MALMTLCVGRMSRDGLHQAVMLVPILLAWLIRSPVPWLNQHDLHQVNDLLSRFGSSLAVVLTHLSEAMVRMWIDQTSPAWISVFFVVGSVVAVLVVPLLLRKMERPAPVTHARNESMAYTITITVLASVGTFYFLEHPKQAGWAFLVVAILVLAHVGGDVGWKAAVQRVLGTLGGVVLLTVVMAIVGGNSFTEVFGIPLPLKLYLIGIVFGMAGIMAKFSPRQWLDYVFIAPAAALLNAFTTSEAAHIGRARFVDNLVGALLVLLSAFITLGAARLSAHRGQSSLPVASSTPSTT